MLDQAPRDHWWPDNLITYDVAWHDKSMETMKDTEKEAQKILAFLTNWRCESESYLNSKRESIEKEQQLKNEKHLLFR